MSEMYLGQIVMFGGNFAMRQYDQCNGQLISVSQNQALFAILGTTYGGNGQTTYALPDLRGRAPVHAGSGPGLTPRSLGQRYGVETVTMTQATMPTHNHSATFTPSGQGGGSLQATTAPGQSSQPSQGNYLATATAEDGGSKIYTGAAPPPTRVDLGGLNVTGGGGSVTVNNAGAGQPFDVEGPRAVVTFNIVVQGTFPSRN